MPILWTGEYRLRRPARTNEMTAANSFLPYDSQYPRILHVWLNRLSTTTKPKTLDTFSHNHSTNMTLQQKENEVAYSLVGTPINIRGVGGSLKLSNDNSITTAYAYSSTPPSKFIMELIEEPSSKEEDTARVVAFRLEGTDRYLTQNPYGNSAQAAALENISHLPLLPEIQQEVVGFAILPDSSSDEGEGFDYQSMRAEPGPPNYLQKFSLTGRGLRGVGVQSIYGKFWRAPEWSRNVLQSSHQLGDETFTFVRAK